MTKALRKKQFHKEAVKVELISSGEQVDSNKSLDLLEWDPISSGEGDLLLEDLAKSFTAASNVSKNVKAIDFASVFDSNGSHGFQLEDVISGAKVVSQLPGNVKDNANIIAKELPVSKDGDLVPPNRLDSKAGITSVDKAPSKLQAFGNQSSQVLHPCDTTKALSVALKISGMTTTVEAETNNPSQYTENTAVIKTPIRLRNCDNNKKLEVSLPNGKVRDLGSDIVLDSASSFDPKGDQTSTPLKDRDIPTPVEEDNLISSDIPEKAIGDHLMDEDSTGLDMKSDEKSSPLVDFSLPKKSTENEQLEEPWHDPIRDHVPIRDCDAIRVEHSPSVASDEPQDAIMEDQIHGKPDGESNHPTLVQSSPGKILLSVTVLLVTESCTFSLPLMIGFIIKVVTSQSNIYHICNVYLIYSL